MEAEIGDEIIVGGTEPGQTGRVGTIVGLGLTDGLPQYVVHWLAGDYDTMFSPGASTKIEVCHKRHTDPRTGAG